MSARTPSSVDIVGRYALHGELASGGMAVVHLGTLLGPVGFSRPVAIKQLHPQLAKDPAVRSMFIDEARLASRIRHPNVVPTLDVVTDGDELLLVMEYVHGESLQQLLRAARRRKEPVPLRITLAIMAAVLHGLHAAHEATTETGKPLEIVHRDVSPQNVIVGVDGVARVLDFGIARATVRIESTREGIVKGKLAYMAPEQLGGVIVDRRADVYAAGVLLWEMTTGRRLFVREDGGQVLVEKLLRGAIEAPSTLAPGTPRLLDAIVLHALARDREQRFATAREMALALERVGPLAPASEIGTWVESLCGEALGERAARLRQVEIRSSALSRESPSTRQRVSERVLPGLFDEDDAPAEPVPDDRAFDLPFPMDADDPPMAAPAATSPTISTMSAVATPQAMALPLVIRRRRPRRALAVFGAYAALAVAIVGMSATLRWTWTRGAAGRAASTVSALACPAGMALMAADPGAGVASFCVDRAADPASSDCAARGKRALTQAERTTAARADGAFATGSRCATTP
jgi:eukaryotic-like serine/threonine-protein kinase